MRRWKSRSCRASNSAPNIHRHLGGFRRPPPRSAGNLNLVEADYAWVTRRLMEIAQSRCGGRIVSVLEGGYDLDSWRARPLHMCSR